MMLKQSFECLYYTDGQNENIDFLLVTRLQDLHGINDCINARFTDSYIDSYIQPLLFTEYCYKLLKRTHSLQKVINAKGCNINRVLVLISLHLPLNCLLNCCMASICTQRLVQAFNQTSDTHNSSFSLSHK